MLKKANVLWKRDGKRVFITSSEGTYMLSKRGSFIWDLIGRDNDRIMELYENEFGHDKNSYDTRYTTQGKSLVPCVLCLNSPFCFIFRV